MCVDLLGLVLVQRDKTIEDVIACGSVIVTTLIIWEVVLHWGNWKLLLESIDLIQEQNDGGLDEPSGVADRIEKGQCFLHTVDGLIFEEKLVVLGDSDKEENGGNVLEAVDPLLSLRSLSSDVEHAVCKVTNDESGFGNTSGLDTGSKNVLIVWHVIASRDSGDVVEVTTRLLALSRFTGYPVLARKGD